MCKQFLEEKCGHYSIQVSRHTYLKWRTLSCVINHFYSMTPKLFHWFLVCTKSTKYVLVGKPNPIGDDQWNLTSIVYKILCVFLMKRVLCSFYMRSHIYGLLQHSHKPWFSIPQETIYIYHIYLHHAKCKYWCDLSPEESCKTCAWIYRN